MLVDGSCVCSTAPSFPFLGPNLIRRGPDAQQVVEITPQDTVTADIDDLSHDGVRVVMAGSVLQLRGAAKTVAAVQNDAEGNTLCYNGTHTSYTRIM